MSSGLNSRKLVVATTNQGKMREIRQALAGLPLELLSLEEAGITARCPEEGKTFRENARAKSLFYSQFTPFLTLAEDSGLEITSLAGAPGVLSARFAGPEADDEQNIRKVLLLLKGKPAPERRARFVCYLCLSRQGLLLRCVRGEVKGWIAEEKRGERGFGYDPIFFYRPFGRTFGEISPEQKNKVSHRGRALRKMRLFLEGFLGTASSQEAVP